MYICDLVIDRRIYFRASTSILELYRESYDISYVTYSTYIYTPSCVIYIICI